MYKRQHSGKSEIHDVEILFDIDTEWMFGKNRVESLSEQDWCIVKLSLIHIYYSIYEETIILFYFDDGGSFCKLLIKRTSSKYLSLIHILK